jgi:hypothetical protein
LTKIIDEVLRMLGSQLENQGAWFSAQVWDSMVIDGI